MSQYKEYHPWVDYIPNSDLWDMADVNGYRSSEHFISSLFYEYAQKTPMSTLIVAVLAPHHPLMSLSLGVHRPARQGKFARLRFLAAAHTPRS